MCMYIFVLINFNQDWRQNPFNCPTLKHTYYPKESFCLSVSGCSQTAHRLRGGKVNHNTAWSW